MTYITGIELYLYSLVFCFILAVIVQTVWVIRHPNQEKPEFFKLLTGMGITAGGSSLALFCLMLYLIPTVKVVNADDYHSEWFISNKWPSQLTNVYIDNRSGEPLRLEAVGYGTDKYFTGHQDIPKGAFVELEHSIAGYNTTPPSSISSKSSGEVKWYLYSGSNTMEGTDY